MTLSDGDLPLLIWGIGGYEVARLVQISAVECGVGSDVSCQIFTIVDVVHLVPLWTWRY